MDLVSLLLVGLTTARLCRLLVDDKITERPRWWVLGKVGEGSPLAYLLACYWCVSMYIGPLVALGAWAWGDTAWYVIVMCGLSASYLTGWLASKSED